MPQRLGQTGDDGALQRDAPQDPSALRADLRHESAGRRSYAARHLGMLRDRASVPQLIALLGDDNPWLDLNGLGEGGFPDSNFWDAHTRARYTVGQAAADALRAIGGPGADALFGAGDDPDESVRRWAHVGLSRLATMDAMAVLTEALTHDDMAVRQYADQALWRLESR